MSNYGVKLSTLALAGLSLFAVGSASALEMDLGKPSMSASVGGLVQADATLYFSDDKLNSTFKSGTNMRKMDLSIYGMVGMWDYKAGLSRNPKTNAVTFDDAYIKWNFMDNVSFSAGWMCPEFGMENTTSSAYINSLERSLTGQSFTHKAIKGLSATGKFEKGMLTVGVFVLDRDASVTTGSTASTYEYAGSARLTYMGKNEPGNSWHGGLSLLYTNPGDEWTGNVKDSKRKFGPSNLGATGLSFGENAFKIFNINTTDKNIETSRFFWGLEAAKVMNNFSVSGEYLYATISHSDAALKDADCYNGFNLEGAWVVTGEKRMYNADKHTLAGVMPSSDMGAFEVFGRFSYLNLTSKNVKNDAKTDIGGTDTYYLTGAAASAASTVYKRNGNANASWVILSNLTAGVTWYANEYASLKANVVINALPYASAAKFYGSGATDFAEQSKYSTAFALRAQMSW